jgi:hypothetical protein
MFDENFYSNNSCDTNTTPISVILRGSVRIGRARTDTERLEALERIREKSAADFALRDREIESKKRGAPPPAPAWQKKAEMEAREWFREHPEVPTDEETYQTDDDDVGEVTDIDIADIDIDADGNECRRGIEETEDDAWTDDPSADVDEVFKSLAARGRADPDRWGYRPALGFENGAPLGAATIDICDQGPGRTKGKKEMARGDEAREFQRIRQSYPLNGYDYKVLCYLCDPSMSKLMIAKKLGRTDSAIRAAARRIRKQAATGEFHRRRGGGATGINMDDRQEVGAWLTQPLPVAKCGRKKRGASQTEPKKVRVRVPKRLRLEPKAPNIVARVWGGKPRVRRIKVPDFAGPQADFGALFGAEWGIPIPTTLARAA